MMLYHNAHQLCVYRWRSAVYVSVELAWITGLVLAWCIHLSHTSLCMALQLSLAVMWIILGEVFLRNGNAISTLRFPPERVSCSCAVISALQPASFNALSSQGYTCSIWRVSLCVWLVEVECLSMCGVMLVPFWGLGRPSPAHASVCCLFGWVNNIISTSLHVHVHVRVRVHVRVHV